MHTFFINTSKQELNIFDEIFDIPREVRELVTLSCPLEGWMEQSGGYRDCVRKMGEIIDSYKDVTNDFNLILYVDMISFTQYTSLPLDEHRTRKACIDAIHMLVRHYFRVTIVKELENVGRKAQDVLVIFEENEQPSDTADPERLQKYLWEMSGMPKVERFDELIENIKHNKNREQLPYETLRETIEAGVREHMQMPIINKLEETYKNDVGILFEELCRNVVNVVDHIEVEKYVESFCDKVIKNDEENQKVVYITSFITNRYAESQTSEMRAKRIIELDLFLLRCIYERRVTVESNVLDERDGRRFLPLNWDAVKKLLVKKKSIFNTAYQITVDIEEKYSDLGLAPVLYDFDHEKFGLDEFGNQLTKAVLVDVEDEESGKDKQKRTHKESRIQAVESSIFLNGYVKFDPSENESHTGESVLEFLPDRKTHPEVYKQKAQELRLVHLRYMDSLKAHVGQVLSNYAGRSKDNDPPILKKRDISISETDYNPVTAVINYSEKRTPAEYSGKVAYDSAENGYSNTRKDYFEFYASRSVALTDVEEPCNWLINKVNEITESLRKIKTVFFGLLAAVAILYIPFFVLQFDEIFYNAVSIVTALLSVAIPIALMTFVYFTMREIQKRKYLKVWKEFKMKSQRIIADNDDSTEKYDKLLATCIPRLRWMHEYLTDVEFYMDCCEIARAKLEHHAFKQKAYATAISNILEDLQYCDEKLETCTIDPRDIDFGAAFCNGRKNSEFYSIINAEEIAKLYE